MGNLARLAAAHGVLPSYETTPGQWLPVSESTLVHVLAALGVDASTPRAVREALEAHTQQAADRLLPPTVVRWVAPDGAAPAIPAPLAALPEGSVLTVETQRGETLDWRVPPPGTAPPSSDPSGLSDPSGRALSRLLGDPPPLGCHTLHVHAPDGRTARATLIVTPDRLPRPAGRAFGLSVPLHALLSARSWGMGDLGDLADLADWAGRSLGAGFLQINPLHPTPAGGDASPYRPLARRYPDPVHLRVEDVPEYAYLDPSSRDRVTVLLSRAAALREEVLRKGAEIDRDAVWALKREALEEVHRVPLSPGRRAAYCDFLAEQGQALEDHATWCALAERHGPDWTRWPRELRDPRSARTARARNAHLDRVDFHHWLAWLIDAQLANAQRTARAAGMELGLVHDLAVAARPAGSESWSHAGLVAPGVSVGAAPGPRHPEGADWGLAPWRPAALADRGHAPYRALLRGLLRHAGALRLDHVAGLSRLWWVPEGRPPAEGCYVRYDAEALTAVLALEAHRAGAVVIGDDLGEAEPGLRQDLTDRGVLGTTVLWDAHTRSVPGASSAARPASVAGVLPPPDPVPPAAGSTAAAEPLRRGPDGSVAQPLDAAPWATGAPAPAEPTAPPRMAGVPALENLSDEERQADAERLSAMEGALDLDSGLPPGGSLTLRGATGPAPGTSEAPGGDRAAEPVPAGDATPLPTASPSGRAGADQDAQDGWPDSGAPPRGGLPAGSGAGAVTGETAGRGGAVAAEDRPENGPLPTAGSAPRVPGAALAAGVTGSSRAQPSVPREPEDWPADCLAIAAHHALPSTAARLTGEHVRLRQRLGLLTRSPVVELTDDSVALARWLALFTRLGLLPEGPGEPEAEARAAYRYLARTPARLVGVWLPDAVGDLRSQLVPGSAAAHPNWRLPLADAGGRAVSLEELVTSPRLHALLDEVRRGVHGTS